MKLAVFNGSPRGKNSNTNVIAEAFIKGAEKAGAETENIFLIDKDIAHCRGCFTCWYKTPGQCIYRDDMTDLLETCMSSDIVCFATPVYLWSMTACLKNFMDRLIPAKRPQVIENQGNYDMLDADDKNPDVVIISNAGFPGDNNFNTMKAVMQSVEPKLEIYRNCGMLLRTKNAGIREIIGKYLFWVEEAGFQFVSEGKITNEVAAGLNMELLPVREYIEYISG